MTTALIDGDIIAFRTATSIPDYGNDSLIYHRINKSIHNIMFALQTEDIKIYLSGKDIPNFRYKIYPEYKANRKDKEKPYWLDLCNLYLHEAWEAIYIHGYEADDALGWNQNSNTIICSIDKDLDMIPGNHYNFVKDIPYSITEDEAIKFFYKQMMIGDRADNIFGINQIGPSKASKLIDVLNSEQEMFNVVYNKYNNPKRFVMNACCLWIQQQKGITWAHQNLSWTLPDQCAQEVDLILDYMTSSQTDISMEPIMNPVMMSGIQYNGDGTVIMEKEKEL